MLFNFLLKLLYTVQSDSSRVLANTSQIASNTTVYIQYIYINIWPFFFIIHDYPSMPDPTYIALSNRHTLITRREKRFETCRIKQLLHSFNRMEEKTRGSNCWGHIFFSFSFLFFFLLWAAFFFFMFSKVDLTGTLSWLTDKTQQLSFISCWRLMSHKTFPPWNQKHLYQI